MKRNFGATIIAVVITIIVIAIDWFFWGRPELTDSEGFLFAVAAFALIVALRNDILIEKKSK